MKGALSLGMIVGQLVFGVLGDAAGRRRIHGKELIITMLGTLMVIMLPTNLSHDGVVAWITMWRLVTGVGIGAGMSSCKLCQSQLTYAEITLCRQPFPQSTTPFVPEGNSS
jgi:MFS family permease